MRLLLKRPIYILIFVISLKLLALQIYSQPSITWNRMYDGPFHSNDYARDICESSNGNFYITGDTHSKLLLLKVNIYGDTLWMKSFNNYDISEACIASQDEGCVVAGSGYIVKIDSAGTVVWSVNSIGQCYDIIRTVDNNYLACGSKNVFNGYIIKINSNGAILWQKIYTSNYSRIYNSIIIANDDGYIASGTSDSSTSTPSTGLLTKINDTGSIVWEKEYTIVDNRYSAIISVVNFLNGYVIAGSSGDSLNLTFANSFFARTDNNGNLTYTKKYFSSISEYFLCLKKSNNNNYIFSVYRDQQQINDSIYADFYIVDSTGGIKVSKSVTSPDYIEFNSLLPLANGDIIFAGNADYTLADGNSEDIYLIRTDSLLNFPPNIIGITHFSNGIPKQFYLHQNYPNPFNPATKIRFELPEKGLTVLTVYDILGKEISIMINAELNAGIYEYSFSLNKLTSGIYFYTLRSNNFIQTRKMIMIK